MKPNELTGDVSWHLDERERKADREFKVELSKDHNVYCIEGVLRYAMEAGEKFTATGKDYEDAKMNFYKTLNEQFPGVGRPEVDLTDITPTEPKYKISEEMRKMNRLELIAEKQEELKSMMKRTSLGSNAFVQMTDTGAVSIGSENPAVYVVLSSSQVKVLIGVLAEWTKEIKE